MPNNSFYPTKNDKLVYISKNRCDYVINEKDSYHDEVIIDIDKKNEKSLRILIIGYNEEYKKLILDLKKMNDSIIDVLLYETAKNNINAYVEDENNDFRIIGVLNYNDKYLEELLPNYDRVVVLRDVFTIENENDEFNDENVDKNSIVLLLKLRKIKEKLGLSFRIIISVSNK